ncbi:MAG: acyl-CoA dehydrogenase family protein [Acidobacteria bacterium]|nr:acyl-CoA dehydrogenase family protein [Acidobacteriota bacterium]
MDFTVSDETRVMLELMEQFIQQEVIPLEPAFLKTSLSEIEPKIGTLRGKVKQMGLWGPAQPKEYGGMGLSLTDFALVSEVLGKSPLGHYIFGCHAPDAGNIEILHDHGTHEQKSRWLESLVRGEIRSCFSMTEVELPGSNPVMMDTTAIKDGDDYVINGQKWYTTSADGAAFAIVMAVTNPEAPPHKRASMIIVPTETPGFDLVRNIAVMGHAGDGWFSHAEILYHSCRVPRSNLLGPEGEGFRIAQERLGPGRIHHTMRWLGICRRSLDLLCKRAVTRTIAPDQVLADREIIQAWIAESAAEIEAARALTLQTAWRIEHLGWKEARQEVSMIKFVVANVMQRVVDRALQVFGGLGMTDDTILAFFHRHERAARIYDGADEVHKLSLARKILKPYRVRAEEIKEGSGVFR